MKGLSVKQSITALCVVVIVALLVGILLTLQSLSASARRSACAAEVLAAVATADLALAGATDESQEDVVRARISRLIEDLAESQSGC